MVVDQEIDECDVGGGRLGGCGPLSVSWFNHL